MSTSSPEQPPPVIQRREDRERQARERVRAGRDLPRRRRFRVLRRKLGSALLPMVAPTVLRLLSSTWKTECLGGEHYERTLPRDGSGVLYALWHGRMLVGLPHHAHTRINVLVSPSDDGALITPLLGKFGYGVIRGSSSVGATGALRDMLARLSGGGIVLVTPDGPRGPRHSMNVGLAWMAMKTGYPVLPMGFVADRAWHARSWDRFTVPKFGARVALVYGEPQRVAPDADSDALENATRAIRGEILAAEARGFEHLGCEPD